MKLFGLVTGRFWLAALLAGFGVTAVSLAQPRLLSVSPSDGTTDYDVTQPVVFTFSEEMYPIPPIALPGYSAYLEWTSLGSVPVDYSWDAGSTILTCTFPQNLPGTTQLGWTLNPPGVLESYQLMSFEWFEVLPTTSGAFTTGEGQAPCDPDGIPDSYGSIALLKYSPYTQTSPATPTPSTTLTPAFGAFVESPSVDLVTAASLQRPGGDPEPMGSVLAMFSVAESYSSETELDAAHPGGTYQFEITQLVAGTATVSMNMSAGLPPIPEIANYAAAQGIDASADFTLTWGVFTDATGNDAVGLEILDARVQTVFGAPDVCAGIELQNTDTAITIPAGTFQPGQTYTGTLTFSRVFHRSTDTLPDFGIFGSLERSTAFTLKTTGGTTVTPPGISGISFPTDGSFTFTATDLQIGTTYVVQSSPNAEPASWTQLGTLFVAGSETPFIDTTAERNGTRFYRVVAQ